MKSKSYTPGPWFRRGTLVYFSNLGGFDLRDCPNAEANAALCAAAPDMHEALDAAQRLIEYVLPRFDWSKSALDAKAIRLLNEVQDQVRKALAKAQI